MFPVTLVSCEMAVFSIPTFRQPLPDVISSWDAYAVSILWEPNTLFACIQKPDASTAVAPRNTQTKRTPTGHRTDMTECQINTHLLLMSRANALVIKTFPNQNSMNSNCLKGAFSQTSSRRMTQHKVWQQKDDERLTEEGKTKTEPPEMRRDVAGGVLRTFVWHTHRMLEECPNKKVRLENGTCCVF